MLVNERSRVVVPPEALLRAAARYGVLPAEYEAHSPGSWPVPSCLSERHRPASPGPRWLRRGCGGRFTTPDRIREYRDNLYDEYGVAVETDGSASHPVEARWSDIARDNAAAVNGVLTLRLRLVQCDVAALLRRRSGRGCAEQPWLARDATSMRANVLDRSSSPVVIRRRRPEPQGSLASMIVKVRCCSRRTKLPRSLTRGG
jgi:hypothetical protein